TDALLVADVQPQGSPARLSLDGAGGRLLVRSDARSATDPVDEIDEHVTAGTYFLGVDSLDSGDFTLTTELTPASPPFQPLPGDGALALGDFNGDGIPDLATPD